MRRQGVAVRRLSSRWPRVQPEFSPLFKKRDMPGAIFLACVRAWACGVCQSDALTLLYTLVCVALRACTEQNLPYDRLPVTVKAYM